MKKKVHNKILSLFIFHYWLLKVHCEVSVNLSVILSSIILKIGRFSIIWIFIVLNIFFVKIIFYLSLLGIIYYSLLIFLNIDF